LCFSRILPLNLFSLLRNSNLTNTIYISLSILNPVLNHYTHWILVQKKRKIKDVDNINKNSSKVNKKI
jgi:hypothetical protein